MQPFLSRTVHHGILSTLLGLMVLAGCSPPPRPTFEDVSVADNAQRKELPTQLNPLNQDLGDAIALKSVELPWETWHSYFMSNKPIGYIHVKSEVDAENGAENGAETIRTTIRDQLTLRRGTSTLVQSLRQTSVENREGGLVSFDADLRVGPVRTQYEGQYSLDTLTTSMLRGTQRQTGSLPWSKSFGGLAAVQQSLLSKPMSLNETRRLKLLLPVQYQLGTVELNCRNRASISIMDGTVVNALEIDVKTITGNGEAIESTVWIDEKGDLLKTYVPSLDLSAIKSTQEIAEAAVKSPADLFAVVSVDLKGSFSKPADAYRTSFVLKPKSKAGKTQPENEPASISLEPQHAQWFQKQNDGTIQLLVSRDPSEPVGDGFTTLTAEPDDGDLQSGPIIDGNASGVGKLASLSQATDPMALALDLTQTVKQLIGSGDFSRGFATASQTAQDGVGDCTERAVLLAAMLRARKIPAKVVAGLVYTEASGRPQMAYHMWTIAWIDERWVALDATIGGRAPADRIAIASSNLADGNEYNCLAPILTAVGKMDIEVLDVKYQPLE